MTVTITTTSITTKTKIKRWKQNFHLFLVLLIFIIKYSIKMEIRINNNQIKLKKTFRSVVAYESATNKSFNPKTISDTILYFYCVCIASDTNLELSYDEFIDWLDDNPEELGNFSKWIIDQNENESKLTAKKKKTSTKSKQQV